LARRLAFPIAAAAVFLASAAAASRAVPFAWDAGGRDLVQRHVTADLFHAAAVITDLAWTPALVPASALAFAALIARRRRDEAVRFAVTVVAAVALTAIFKVALDRPRPPPMDRTMGFPSGHVVVGACFYLGLARCVPRAWPRARTIARAAAFALCAVITVSRLVLGNHYPSDVTGAIALAALVLWAARDARGA
jgi:undecaprenyl-diphosphatase